MSVWARSWCAILCVFTALIAGADRRRPTRPQGKAQTRIVFVTDWKAQAEHGGFYQALAEGLYAKRGLDVVDPPGRTRGQRAADPRRRRRRFRHGLERLHPAQSRARRREGQSRDGRVPEGPAGADHASARRCEIDRRHEGQADPDRRRLDGDVLAVAESEVRLLRTRRSANTRSTWRPSSSTRTRSRKAICHPNPIRSRRKAASRRKSSCSPTTAIPATPTWCWCRDTWIAERPAGGAGLRRRDDRGLDALSLRRSHRREMR